MAKPNQPIAYNVDPDTGIGTFKKVKEKKVAKKNYQRKHTNDASYSDPPGGHETQYLPTKRIKA
jgi:hypothetical protein